MLIPFGWLGMNTTMDDISLMQQAQRHHLVPVVRELGEEIDLEIGAGADEASFANRALIGGPPPEPPSSDEHDDGQNLMGSELPNEQGLMAKNLQVKRKKKAVKRWREEWADRYKWAYVDVKEGTTRIFCSVCREFGRKHRRSPYGNEGSRNMQMSALEEHNNSLLHKEAVRLQLASKDKNVVEKSIYVKAIMWKTAGSIVEATLKKDLHEAEYVESVQEVVHALERVSKKFRICQHDGTLIRTRANYHFQSTLGRRRGETHVNRGFRVQFGQMLGPCRGCLCFLSVSICKFLGFEQTLNNALSPYKLGGAAGGSDSDPKGKSDSEDLPSEEMGVGTREMGYLFGQHRCVAGHFQGSFTGPRIF